MRDGLAGGVSHGTASESPYSLFSLLSGVPLAAYVLGATLGCPENHGCHMGVVLQALILGSQWSLAGEGEARFLNSDSKCFGFPNSINRYLTDYLRDIRDW